MYNNARITRRGSHAGAACAFPRRPFSYIKNHNNQTNDDLLFFPLFLQRYVFHISLPCILLPLPLTLYISFSSSISSLSLYLSPLFYPTKLYIPSSPSYYIVHCVVLFLVVHHCPSPSLKSSSARTRDFSVHAVHLCDVTHYGEWFFGVAQPPKTI